jgi:hypothetical protein
MEGLKLQLAPARLELESLERSPDKQQQQDDNGAMEGLKLQLAMSRLEQELSQSAREQAASDLSLARY